MGVVADVGGDQGALVLPAGLFGLSNGEGSNQTGNQKDYCANPSCAKGSRYGAFLGLRLLGGTTGWDAGTLEFAGKRGVGFNSSSVMPRLRAGRKWETAQKLICATHKAWGGSARECWTFGTGVLPDPVSPPPSVLLDLGG